MIAIIKCTQSEGTCVTRYPAARWFALHADYGDSRREIIRNVNLDYRIESQNGPSAGNVCTSVQHNARRQQIVAVTSW